jgi:RNA polymerase-interacting CarD/CdnL/TRCF family regulator
MVPVNKNCRSSRIGLGKKVDMHMSKGEVVAYKYKGMYRVKDIGTLGFTLANRKKKYYTLQSIDNATDRAYVPTDDKVNLRKPMSRAEVFKLIREMDDIEIIGVKNERTREKEYMECIADNRVKGWMKILKTLSTRSESRGMVSSMDKHYQQLAEHALYSELSYVLDIPTNKVIKFLLDEKENNNTESA